MEELVSVIMPTYKGANIIKKSIFSLVNQTYKNLEIIIVDDNGEGTKEQIDTFNSIKELINLENIKYICHKNNMNGSCARNTGILFSKGAYICFLDDDDSFMPNKIEKQVMCFKNDNEIGLVYTGVKEIYSSGREENRIPANTKNFTLDYLKCQLFVCSSSIMVRRKFVELVNGWDESFSRHQDMEFIVRVSSICKVKSIDECLVLKYREDRNFPNNPKMAEIYRNHYLTKMLHFINLYSRKEQRQIYLYNWLQVGKLYLKQKKIIGALRIALKSKNFFKMIYMYFKDGARFLKRR